ncbi:Protein SSO2 [Smittium mucronatum]|uniref:Protein SSO2 n=1 Tax=Smittium mucronatum TaxID=133383 RepID=A0A1R0H7H3_9FUNG|nr:Protein SSO2 [Smittium mucronatum]
MGSKKSKKNNQENDYDPEKTRSVIDISEKYETSDLEFFEINDRVKQNLAELGTLSDETSKSYNKILGAISGNDYSRLSKELDEVDNQTRALINQVNSDLNKLGCSSDEGWLSGSQRASRKGRHQVLAKSFSAFIQKYQDQKSQYKKNNEQRLARQFRIIKPDATEQEIEDAVSDENPQLFSSLILDSSKSRSYNAKKVLGEVEQRHTDILKTQKAITELSELFIQINSIINQQQGAIDSIESAVEDANVHIEVGTVEVEKAIVYRRKSRKVKNLLSLIYFFKSLSFHSNPILISNET